MKEVTELVIDRARWGVGSEGGSLYDSDTRKMCCLGFLARACGSRVSDIDGLGYPPRETVPDYFASKSDDVNSDPEVGAFQAARVNDNETVTSREREKKIKEIFSARGIKVKFVGAFPKQKKAALVKFTKPKKKAA